MTSRVDWHTYFMNIAKQAATRSTCDRKHVGAVIVRDKTILSTGYNGSIRGMPHCDEVGHLMENGPLHRDGARRGQRDHPGGQERRADRRRRALHHRVALLELLQADRQRRDPAGLLRRVLPG